MDDSDIDRDEYLHELAERIPHDQPWHTARGNDGALVLWCGNEPLCQVYAGVDFARYLEAVSPARLFGGHR